MVYEYRKQPAKGVYLTAQIASTLLFRLPYWLVTAAFRRPRPSWTFGRTVALDLMREVVRWEGKVQPLMESPDYRAIVEGCKGVWIEPVPELIIGDIKIWAEQAGAQAVRIPGYWFDKEGQDTPVDEPPKPGENVVYALHGGAFVACSGYPNDPPAAAFKGLMKHCASVRRVFSLEYRLSTGPPVTPEFCNPFPAALVDAIMGYNHLVRMGFAPEDIILSGDSAGGNLAVALVRYLMESRAQQSSIPLPAPPHTMVLFSPWCDIGSSHWVDGMSAVSCQGVDLLPVRVHGTASDGCGYPAHAYIGTHSASFLDQNRFISPASRSIADPLPSFSGFPRTFIVAGGAEVFRDSIRTLKDRMIKDMGEGRGQRQVFYLEKADLPHDFCIIPGFGAEAEETFVAAAQWVSEA